MYSCFWFATHTHIHTHSQSCGGKWLLREKRKSVWLWQTSSLLFFVPKVPPSWSWFLSIKDLVVLRTQLSKHFLTCGLSWTFGCICLYELQDSKQSSVPGPTLECSFHPCVSTHVPHRGLSLGHQERRGPFSPCWPVRLCRAAGIPAQEGCRNEWGDSVRLQ